MNSLGAREDMNSDFEGSSFRVVQTIEQTKFCSIGLTLKEVNDMATEQKRNKKFQAPNMPCPLGSNPTLSTAVENPLLLRGTVVVVF